jgi:Ferritin-like domain
MSVHGTRPGASADAPAADPTQQELNTIWRRVVGRRSFLKQVGFASAAAVPASAIAASAASARSNDLTQGDVDVLRFLAAAELIESDLWEQYAELGGVNGGNPAYMAALQNLDMDMPQYIADNTDDEESHAAFINKYLRSKGADEVNLDEFRILLPSAATGAKSKKRLTTLKKLNVDTSWWLRYRSTENPDLGASFGQAVTIKNQPAIPLNDTDTPPNTTIPTPPFPSSADPKAVRMQAIANSAGFHFAFIEQGGSSLYNTMSMKVTSLEVLRIVVSIGGVEINHFAVWHDKAGNAVSQPLAGITDPETGTTFPDLNAPHSESLQTNLIMPEPCDFISESLPECSVIRPDTVANAGAVAAIKGFAADGLFDGQSAEFLSTAMKLAKKADAATRRG